MQAGISVCYDVAQVKVSDRLRKGCVFTPTLFILFFNMVVWCWRDHCKLQGNLLVKELEYLVKLCFANDAAILVPTKEYVHC